MLVRWVDMLTGVLHVWVRFGLYPVGPSLSGGRATRDVLYGGVGVLR